MMRRSETEILDSVYRRSAQIRLRRRVLQAITSVVAAAIILTAIPTALRQLALQEVNTADQPPSEGKEETSTEGDGKSDSSSPGPVSTVAPGRTGGTSSPGTGGSSKDSRSGGLPAGTIPRGFEIAFQKGGGGISLMNADGSDLRVLRAAGKMPGWSPDARLIAFTDNGDIQLMNADGSGYENLRARGSSPTWSPDGGWLAFNRECDAQFGGPCEQPDGTKKDCGPECGIGVVSRDGTGVRRLGNGISPDWGPDGRILFSDGTCNVRPTDVGGPPGLQCTFPIWVMNPDGSGRTRLPVDEAVTPTWSHDGRRIAYYTPTDGVFIANSDGTGIVKVAPEGYVDPSWSPDGLWLALTGYSTHQELCGPGRACHNIYLRGIDGSAERRLTSSNNDLFPAFSPRP